MMGSSTTKIYLLFTPLTVILGLFGCKQSPIIMGALDFYTTVKCSILKYFFSIYCLAIIDIKLIISLKYQLHGQHKLYFCYIYSLVLHTIGVGKLTRVIFSMLVGDDAVPGKNLNFLQIIFCCWDRVVNYLFYHLFSI